MTKPLYTYNTDWEITTLEEDKEGDFVVEISSGSTPSTRNPNYWGGTILWITPKEITKGKTERYVSQTERTITDLGFKYCSSKLYPPRTVLLTKRAPVGEVVINLTPMATNQGFLNFKCGKKLLPEFLYYWLKANLPYLEVVANGSTYLELYCGDMFEFQIPKPSFVEQQAISKILSTLDDLIELYKRKNNVIDQIVKSTFKSWFLDFEIKNGSSTNDWERKKIDDVCTVEHGYAFKGQYFKENPTENVLLTPGNFAIGGGFTDTKMKYYDGPISEKFILDGGDLLITMTDLSKNGDTLGYPAFVPRVKGITYLHNQRLGKVYLKNENQVSKNFLYYLMRTKAYRNEILASHSGSSVKHTSPERICDFKFLLPPPKLISNFESVSNHFIELIESNYRSLLLLKKIKNLILPKLISGKLRIKEPEKFLEDFSNG